MPIETENPVLIRNHSADFGQALDIADIQTLGPKAADEVQRFLDHREDYAPTPLVPLPALAAELGIGAIHIKDEGKRLGLGSFKALGGAYATIRLAVEETARRLGRPVDIAAWRSPEVAKIAAGMTVACATDGNHGRSVAQGAQLVGAQCVIFVHEGVSEARRAAIAGFGARIVRVKGNYDDSVCEASRMAQANGWIVVSDTSWSGYEQVPRLVMQGYTALLRETLAEMPTPPTHVFIQAGVGGIAATVAAHFALVFGDSRPFLTVVDPSNAACLFESAKAGRPVKIAHNFSTVMAMLECHEPSMIAWRILSRAADAFMTVEDDDAIAAMKRLAFPLGDDPAIVAGESGGVGLAALMKVARNSSLREQIGLGPDARIFLINTEGATDPALYKTLIESTGNRGEQT